MRGTPAALAAATLVAALGLVGCGNEGQPAATGTLTTISTTTTTPPPPPPPAPLPTPEALTDVLYRLADVNVAGAQKVALVERATVNDAAALDTFSQALRDGGYVPLTFEARDLAWSQVEPGNVVATVVVKGPTPRPGGDFSFPMEFSPANGSWQMTRHTADLLLQIGVPAPPGG